MFENTIDKKDMVTDKNGNTLVDLTTSIFKRSSRGISTSNTVRMSEYFQMRADKVAISRYSTDDGTEYILKYSGISNPFSLDKDDILIIPDMGQAMEQMASTETNDATESNENQVKLYYKFTNTDFKSSSASYDALAAKKIPSGILDPTDNTGSFTVPYISDDGMTAVTIKNGRMYFGNVPNKQDKCLTDGMTTAEYIAANAANFTKESVNDISTAYYTAEIMNTSTYKAVASSVDSVASSIKSRILTE